MKSAAVILLLITACFGSMAAAAQDTITSAQVKGYVGKKVLLCDRVNFGKFVDVNKDAPIRLYVGPDYPNHNLTLVIPETNAERFKYDAEDKMINKRFCVHGTVTRYKGKPAIYITNYQQLNVEE